MHNATRRSNANYDDDVETDPVMKPALLTGAEQICFWVMARAVPEPAAGRKRHEP